MNAYSAIAKNKERNACITYLRDFSIFCIVLHHSILVFQGCPMKDFCDVEVPNALRFVSIVSKEIGLSVLRLSQDILRLIH